MKLSLQSTHTTVHTAAAAFIRGASAMEWLSEISRLRVPLQSLECYILPASIRTVEPAGLLVIFKDAKAVENLLLPDAYGVLAGKLYLPVQSSLYPEVTANELKKILLWHVQVFHPTVGFVGFEEKDQLNLSDLFTYTLPQKTTWRHAHPGLPVKPPLQQIMVKQPTPEEIIQSVKDTIGNKPLEDIPGNNDSKTTAIEKLLDSLKYGLFKGLASLSNAFDSVPSGSGSGGGTGTLNLGNYKPGLLDRLLSWVARNMAAIEKKRQNEIQRLLRLFDTNMDEALQYAIPLDSPYLNRGTAPPSAVLGRRPTNFNLGKLGGGGPVDNWDVGDHYQSLRSKYLASAQAALDKKDYKKAAYVYAHLLGDYHSAANALVQGKFYREAAALYKDHLKNIPAAAECLENGGLLMEATELYIALERLEKAGDLYHQMEQPQQASHCYEKVVDKLLSGNDYLEASRLIQEKLQQTERAKEVLLEGWEGTNKSEACLKRYYDLVAQTERENMVHHLEKVYAKGGITDHRFLNVLVHVREHHPAAGVEQASQKMAYEIVSHQAISGDTSGLHQLKTFVPDDRLIASDTSRFVQSRPKPQIVKPQQTIQLNKAIQWLDATWYRNQIIAIGVENNQLHLARANWYGSIEYYSWTQMLETNQKFFFFNKNNHVNTILLRNSGFISFDKKVLPKNKYFSEEIVIDPTPWINRGESVIAQEYGFTVLEKTGKLSPLLQFYNQEGVLKKAIDCKPPHLDTYKFHHHSRLDFWNGHYYADAGHHLAVIKEDGTFISVSIPNSIHAFAISKFTLNPWIIASNGTMGYLYKHEQNQIYEYGSFEISSSNAMIRFLSQEKFISFGKMHAALYEIENNTVSFKQRITVESPIIDSIPVPHQGQFGFIHQDGSVSLHTL